MSDISNIFISDPSYVHVDQSHHNDVYYDADTVISILNENNIIMTGALHLYSEFNPSQHFYEETLGVSFTNIIWIEGNDILYNYLLEHNIYSQSCIYHATLMDFDDVDANIYTLDTLISTKNIDISSCDVWYIGFCCNLNVFLGASYNIQYAKVIFIHVNYDLDGNIWFEIDNIDTTLANYGFKRVLLNKLHAMYIRTV